MNTKSSGLFILFLSLFIIFISNVRAADHAREAQTLTVEQKMELIREYFKSPYQEEDYFRTDRLLLQSVSFFPTESRKAPGSSYIITDEQIKKSPARTLNDIVAMQVPGMSTGGHERHGPIIGTRGTFIDNNAKTMVMLDEQQINQRSHFGYTSGLLSPLLGDLRQVEVILGPGAILHGSGALNGFINLIPKNGIDNPGWFVDVEYGFAEELWKFETGWGASYEAGGNIYLYAGMYEADGYEPDALYGYNKNFDIHSKGFGEDNYRLSLYWNHKNLNLNTFFYENNPYKNSSAETGYFHQATLGLRPKYNIQINNTDSLELTGSFLWSDFNDQRFPPLFGPAPAPPPRTVGGSESHWELKNIFRTTRWQAHALAAGFSVGEKRFYERKHFFSTNADIPFSIVDTKWLETSIFGEDIITLTSNWTASFGLRYDNIHLGDMYSGFWQRVYDNPNNSNNPYASPNKEADSIDGHLSPRIATAYDLDKNTTAKVSYQHGFRAPDAAYYRLNLLYRDAADYLGYYFPSLEIETLDSFELNFQKNFPEKKVMFDCNIFYNIFNDLLSWTIYEDTALYTDQQLESLRITADPTFPPSFHDIGSIMNAHETIRVKGGEMGVTFEPVVNNELRISYGYIDSDADQIRFPKHQVKVNTLSSFWDDRIHFSLSYLYNSGYSESDLSMAHEIYRDARHVVDAALTYNVTADLNLCLTVNNLFQEDVLPMVFEPDRPDRGGIGYDERLIYVALNFRN